jgi:hypothetical protein
MSNDEMATMERNPAATHVAYAMSGVATSPPHPWWRSRMNGQLKAVKTYSVN